MGPGVTLVLGGDGRGKSTLLRLLAGDLTAAGGQLRIGAARLDAAAPAYRAQLFWIDPRSEDFEQLTALEYFQSVRERYPDWAAQALPGLIAGLSLEPHLDKKLYMLSTGSKRKVWLAAAFASGAPVMLLDEPFASLDKVSIGFVRGLLREVAGAAARVCVLADYSAPSDVPLAATIDLGD
nr:ATP-binding cassette domain-containing protein [Janthinobacterium sp.]